MKKRKKQENADKRIKKIDEEYGEKYVAWKEGYMLLTYGGEVKE